MNDVYCVRTINEIIYNSPIKRKCSPYTKRFCRYRVVRLYYSVLEIYIAQEESQPSIRIMASPNTISKLRTEHGIAKQISKTSYQSLKKRIAIKSIKMTIEEFNNTKWHYGMEAVIHSEAYGTIQRPIVTVNFDQALIGIETDGDDKQLDWFRCENCEIVDKP